ncbi:MAG: NADH-quinone oxidoreductase subunit A [Cytophagales bacterium]
MQNNLSDFGVVLIFIIGGILFLNLGLLLAQFIRPNKPNAEKLTTYESGEETIGNAWNKFNVKYYSIAIIFILFEVELMFLFPWATIFGNEELNIATQKEWGWFSLVEMGIFIGILILGLAYAWANGYIDWVQPNVKPTDYKGVVPNSKYEAINSKY